MPNNLCFNGSPYTFSYYNYNSVCSYYIVIHNSHVLLFVYFNIYNGKGSILL